MSHRLNPGDVVLVKSDIPTGRKFTFVPGMCEFLGKLVTIRSAYDGAYRIEEDNCKWCWERDFFENYYVVKDDIEYDTVEESDILDFLLGGEDNG